MNWLFPSFMTGDEVRSIIWQHWTPRKGLHEGGENDEIEKFHEKNKSKTSTNGSYERFQGFWEAQLTRDAEKNKNALTTTLLKTFWTDVLKAAALKLAWSGLLIFSIAFFVFRLLTYIRFKATDKDHTLSEATEAYILCPYFFLAMALFSISLQQMSFTSSSLGQKVKSVLATAIFTKMLKREGSGSDADVVSLAGKDCAKVADACTSMQFLWSGIVESLGILGVLMGFIGVSALPGLGLLLVALPLKYVLGVSMAYKKKKVLEESKKRVKLTEEIFRGIKLVKIYGWEVYFRQIIDRFRKQETNIMKVINLIKSFILAMIFTCPPLFCLVIFGTHEAFDQLDPILAFTTLTFFNTLRLPFVKLPKSLRDVLDAKLALERIQNFLLEVDAAEFAISKDPEDIHFSNAAFSYGVEAEILLRNVDIRIVRGSITMVSGPVASGKSNFIKAILGQMTCRSGNRTGGGKFAYVPQFPWTALGTIRDNILFGMPWDESRYRKVIFACALETDLGLMVDGDLTYIGERGGNLSGGQKQRIAVARAAYSNAEIFVLDSPLSALDMHTGQHIFKHCIQDIMLAGGGTVILATHQTELFARAQQIVVMQECAMAYCGKYHFETIKKYFPNAVDVSDAEFSKLSSGSETSVMIRTPSGPSKTLVLHSSVQKKIEVKSSLEGGKTESNSYLAYVKFLGCMLFAISIIIFIGAQIIRIFSDIWISRWATRQYMDRSETWYIVIYLVYVACFFAGVVVRSAFFLGLGTRAANRIHDTIFNVILKAPMAFFITTPVGNLLSFFSKDMDVIDDVMVDNMCMCITYFCILCTTLGVVIGNLLVFLAIVGGLALLFLYTFRRYLFACAGLKTVTARMSDNVVAQTSESLNGLSVIRAFGAQNRFRDEFIVAHDRANTSSLALNTLSLWLAFRIDMIGCLLVIGTALLAVLNEGGISAAASGLAVSNAFQILLFFSIMSSTMGEIHTNMAAVERAMELSKVEAERDFSEPTEIEQNLSPSWPSKGNVSFHSVIMSYLPGLPPVLKGVDFELIAGEKVGVVGRTGAGKSTLIMAIYRMVELSAGKVLIDGIDSSQLCLGTLRSRIAIIPQEPIMFSGTLRSNLDPFGRCTDKVLMDALEACLLGPMVKTAGKGLDSMIEFMGSNLSLGQQQLICLTRAMLNPSRLLMLDEATASLDSDTDAAVQQVLRRNFADRTILSIAHRLDTIIDSDRILVMDAGKAVEFEAPEDLLSRPDSIFCSLCRKTGPAQFRALQSAANEAAANRGKAKAYNQQLVEAVVTKDLSSEKDVASASADFVVVNVD